MRKYDEQQELPSPWEWVIITLFTASIIGYGILIYHVIDNGPRRWDVGQLPDTPAESIYSTEEPWKSPAARQTPPLPEAQPENPRKPPNVPLRERELH